MATTNVITDSLLYTGGNECFGRAKKITPPKITYGGVEIKDIASIGKLTLPNGKLEISDCNITLNSFYKEIFRKVANPFQAVEIKVYNNIFEFQNDTKIGSESVKLLMRCSSKELELLPEINEHDGKEHNIALNCSMVQLIVGNKEEYHVDVVNDIWIIDGVNIRDEIKRNLGMS